MIHGFHAPRSALGSTSPPVLWAVALAGLLCIAAFVFGGDALRWIRGTSDDDMAITVGAHMMAIQSPVERFVNDRNAQGALTPQAFDDDRRGQGGVFDPAVTGVARPVPPPGAFERPGGGRYRLEVGDFTGRRGPDHMVGLRGVTEGVCRAYNLRVRSRPDPFDVDPGDRYARTRGCIADPDTGEFVVFAMLYSS